jgi:hypothetical protein
MTIDERVEWCLDQKGGRPLFGDEARVILRQAIMAAVEAERTALAERLEAAGKVTTSADAAEAYRRVAGMIRERNKSDGGEK